MICVGNAYEICLLSSTDVNAVIPLLELRGGLSFSGVERVGYRDRIWGCECGERDSSDCEDCRELHDDTSKRDLVECSEESGACSCVLYTSEQTLRRLSTPLRPSRAHRSDQMIRSI